MFRTVFLVSFALIGTSSACESDVDPVADTPQSPDTATDAVAETTAPTDTADSPDQSTPQPDLGAPVPDAGNTADTTAPADADPDAIPTDPDPVACPPTGPTGTAIGDLLADTTLTACDGTPVSLHSFCGRPLYINTFAGWCPPCRTDATNAAATARTLPTNAQWLFVITETNNGSLPTTTYCESIRDAYGLTMPVVIDTRGTFPAHIGVTSPNSWHLVLDAGVALVHRVKYDQRGALDALHVLAR
jgi:thiol-disulfide isomerase/thioredoxin